MTLLICTTCPRYDARRSGRFARDVIAALTDAVDGAPIETRKVACLGGCPRDGVVALDAPGKARVRFAALDAGHVGAVLAAARAYDASDSGRPDDWSVPSGLAAHLSAVTMKRC